MTGPDSPRDALLRLIRAAGRSRLDDLAIVAGLPKREAGESEDSLRRRMAADLDAEPGARCSFCRKRDWAVGRLVASADGRAFLCDECEASAHAVMTETPVPPPLGEPPIVRKSLRVDWQKSRHHQTHGPR
jgi:ClpX C4-type zinc finger